MNRFDYLKNALNLLSGRGEEPYIYMINLSLDIVEYLELKATGKLKISKESLNNPLLFSSYKINDVDLLIHINYLEKYKAMFDKGNKEAIFEYVKKDPLAFRSSWIINQIESWRKENTKASKENLRRLIRYYTYSIGKTAKEQLKDLLKRDKEIYEQILIMREKTSSLEKCFEELEKKYNLSFESIREIYVNFKEIDILVANFMSECRGYSVGYPPANIPSPEEFDEILNDLFQLDEFINSLDWQLKLYKKMRYMFEGVEYYDIPRPDLEERTLLNKKAREEKDLLKLKKIIGEISIKKHKPYSYIADLYVDFRGWEKLRNGAPVDNELDLESLRKWVEK